MKEHPLVKQLMRAPYAGYVYAYPHKTAYRSFDPPIPKEEVWREADKSALFLYLHVPFCEMRCGFCNLFTVANPKPDLQNPFLDALERQMLAARAALSATSDSFRFARFALGGGTPTFLSHAELERLFRMAKTHLGVDPKLVPTGIEVSPGTVDAEKLAFLHEIGVERVSMGVQSFHPEIVKAMGRPEADGAVVRALELLKSANFPRLNLDLIYGAAGQTEQKWTASLEKALSFQPEEIYLYPLYVRPLTGLEKTGRSWDDHRLALYRIGRDLLIANGYEQVSMRMFRKIESTTGHGPLDYRCQEDGMLGLGPGARSYTRKVHYSSEYAVKRQGVKQIIHDYHTATEEDFGWVRHGVRLSMAEEKRRYLLKSLLNREGLAESSYRDWFGTEVNGDFEELELLREAGLAVLANGTWRLTPEGMSLSDAIGPWLYSAEVQEQMEAYAWS